MFRCFRRKYNIDEMIEKILFELNFFDVMFVDGESLIEIKFIDRRNKFEEIVKESEKIKFVE